MTTAATTKAYELLGAEAEALLSYEAKGFNKKDLHLPGDRKSTRLNSSHLRLSRMPSSA